MPLPPCGPCECIPANIGDDKFKQDVEVVLCQALVALGYEVPEGVCNPCECIQGNIPNDKFKQDIEILLCYLLTAVQGGGGGGGTVTAFSFTNANGFTGVVTNPTTTPDLTLSIANDAISFAQMQNIATDRLLGREAAGSGNIEEIALGTGLSMSAGTLNVSGAALAITALTGDVTATGPGSSVATIANDAVTFAKMQDIGTGTILGRSTAGSGNPEALTLGDGLSIAGGVLSSSGITIGLALALQSGATAQ